jgi:hypothetical protein
MTGAALGTSLDDDDLPSGVPFFLGPEAAGPPREPGAIAALHANLHERVLENDHAIAKPVEVAAADVDLLAIDRGPLHPPVRVHESCAAGEVDVVYEAQVGRVREARLHPTANLVLALKPLTIELAATSPEEDGVVGEVAEDRLDVMPVPRVLEGPQDLDVAPGVDRSPCHDYVKTRPLARSLSGRYLARAATTISPSISQPTEKYGRKSNG